MRRPWFPFLPLAFVFASLLQIGKRSFGEASTVDALTAHRVLLVPAALMLAGGYLLLRGPPRVVPRALKYFIGYFGVGVVATAILHGSVYSAWKLMELGMVITVGLYALRVSRERPGFVRECYQAWLAYLSFLVVTAVIGAVVFPAEAWIPSLTEETIEAYGRPVLPVQLSGVLPVVNANSLGAIASILLVVQLARLGTGHRLGRALWITLLAAVAVLAQSRTAWMGLAGALMFMVLLSRSSPLAKLPIIIAFVLGAVAGADYIVAYLTRGVSLEHLSSLSGRAAWWASAIEAVRDADPLGKLFGLGFMTANRSLLAERFDSDAHSLHSDYVDALVSTGVLGASFLALAVLSFGWSALKAGAQRTELVAVAFILVVRSLTGTTFSIHNHLLPALFLLPAVARHATRGQMDEVRTAAGIPT